MGIENGRLVVVLGMHRSGTSAITRGLQVIGVSLGEKLIPAVKGTNDKGFWEDIDLNALNIEMLDSIGSDWHHLSLIEPEDVEDLRSRGYLLRAAELLRQKVGSAPIFGVKDPRVAKLLPFWKEVFKHCQLDVSYVVAVRHPLSIVKSLAKRDSLASAQSYLLWLAHVIPSLKGSVGYKRVLVDYDRLMQSPDYELSRIAQRLDLDVDSTKLQHYKTEFLDQTLRHTVFDLNDLLLDDTCPPLVREIYSALLDVAVEKTEFDAIGLQHEVVRWSTEFDRLRSPLVLIDELVEAKLVATQAIAVRDGQIASLNQGVLERDAHIAYLDRIVMERNAHVDHLDRIVMERNAHVDHLDRIVMERNAHVDHLDRIVMARNAHVDHLEQIVAARDVHVANLVRAVDELGLQIANLNQSIAEKAKEIEFQVNERNKVVEEICKSIDASSV